MEHIIPSLAWSEALELVEGLYEYPETTTYSDVRSYEHMVQMVRAMTTEGDNDLYYCEMLDISPGDHPRMMKAIRTARMWVCAVMLDRLQEDCPQLEQDILACANDGFEADSSFICGMVIAALALS